MISNFLVWLCELWVRVVGIPVAMLAIRRAQARIAVEDGIRLMVAVSTVFEDTETVYMPESDGEAEEEIEAIGFPIPGEDGES